MKMSERIKTSAVRKSGVLNKMTSELQKDLSNKPLEMTDDIVNQRKKKIEKMGGTFLSGNSQTLG